MYPTSHRLDPPIGRRLGACLVVALLAVTLPAPARPEPLPIIDTHGHLNADMTAERLVELMDQAGVTRMVLMARYYGGERAGGKGTDLQALKFAQRYPGRFLPFVAGQRGGLLAREVWETHTQVGEGYLRIARETLAGGGFYGLGEFILRHYAYSNYGPQGGSDVDLPVDSALMRRIAELGAVHRVPVLFHAEGEPAVVREATRMLRSAPDTAFVWAHNCGRSSADVIRTLLNRHANLMCDLGAMAAPGSAGYGTYWPRRTQWMHLIEDGQGHLLAPMKALFEEFPDRFMIGTDAAHTPALDDYLRRIARFRVLLAQLRPETAQMLAHRNAQRVFRLRP